MKKIFLLVILMVTLISCRDSGTAQLFALGDDCKVELINADGSVTYSWISSGKVATEGGSDGYYFMDKTTEKLIRVSGNLIITIAEPKERIVTISPIILDK
jgi:hypothetical protein